MERQGETYVDLHVDLAARRARRVADRLRQGQQILRVDAGPLHGPAARDQCFASIDDASAFFEAGSLGYSPSRRAGTLDGLGLRTRSWHVEPLATENVYSAFFQDPQTFPASAVRLDSALLMRDVDHTWHAHAPLCCVDASPDR